jgi:hypothetical protein
MFNQKGILMSFTSQENAFRWTPRLLGISPLLIFSIALLNQGGPVRGIFMVLSLLLLMVLLLVFYTLTSILSAPEIKCNPPYAWVGNPLMSWLCYRGHWLIYESSNTDRSAKSLSQHSLWGALLSVFRWLMLAVIASPHPNPNDPAVVESANKESSSPQVLMRETIKQDNPILDFCGEKQNRFFSGAEAIQSVFRWFAGYLLKLRIQVGIMLICLLLFQTQQVKDVVLAMVLDDTPRPFIPSPFGISTLFGLVLSLLLWHTARQITRLFPEIEKSRKDPGITKKTPMKEGIFSYTFELLLFWFSWVSLALFTVPVAREAYGGFAGGGNWNLYVLLVLGALMIFLWRVLDRPKSTWTGRFPYWFYALFALAVLIPIAIQGLTANQLPHFLGSVALLFWALSIYLVIASTIYQFSLITNFPLFSLLLVGVYLININRINDNHAVRLLPHDEQIAAGEPRDTSSQLAINRSLLSLKNAFEKWYNERPSRDPNKPYPVYVVSSQGGGIYAAYHTAKSLAVLTEEVPGFSDHIFAISGVSGGSVGASVFVNALRTANPEKQGEFKHGELSRRIDDYFGANNDRLAMILSTMLFGDTMQRFYPLPVPAWDRSLGLELGFENLFPYRNPGSGTLAPIQLDLSFYSDQASNQVPGRQGRAPYLALNTTEVENGRRYILSPFRIDSDYSDADFHEPWLRRPEQMKPLDLRYSTAAGMSARFPIVSPYGFFPEARARRFIDGGLYDNSGAITAKEIINELKSLGIEKKYKIIIIPIAIVDDKAVNLDSSYADAENLAQRKQFRLFGWSAIDAVLSTREARLQKAVDLLDRSSTQNQASTQDNTHNQAIDSKQPATSNNPTQMQETTRRILLHKEFRLSGDPNHIFSVPLGWKLSCQARAFINDQIQPYPKNVKDVPKTSTSTPKTADGNSFQMVPCEKTIQAVKREPVRTHLDKAPRNSSLSLSFWKLIDQLKADFEPPTAPVGTAGGAAAKVKSVAAQTPN